MLKRISFMLLLSLTLFIGLPSLISHAESTTNEFENYGKYALWFIGTDIYTNPESKWTEDTRIDEIIPMKNMENEVIGYTFELKKKKKNEENGYVFVKYVDGNLVIAEYSYEGTPLYYVPNVSGKIRDIFVNDSQEYFVLTNSGKFYDLNGNQIESLVKNNSEPSKKILNNELNKSLKDFEVTLSEWTVGYDGQISAANGTNAGIINMYAYLVDRYGTGWNFSREKYLPVDAYVQRAFSTTLGLPDRDNCVLSSVVTLLKYYQSKKGYSLIPNSVYTIYTDVRKIAISYGYDPSGGGVFPTKLNNIVEDSFAKYGYSSVKSSNDYTISFSEMENLINLNRPFIFSNTGGYYSNHAFVVRGYRVYAKGNAERQFVRVNDNWTTDERWYDVSAFNCCGSTTILSK